MWEKNKLWQHQNEMSLGFENSVWTQKVTHMEEL